MTGRRGRKQKKKGAGAPAASASAAGDAPASSESIQIAVRTEPAPDATLDVSASEMEQEVRHFEDIVLSYLAYRSGALGVIARTAGRLASLPASDRQRLDCFRTVLPAQRACVEANARFIDLIVNPEAFLVPCDLGELVAALDRNPSATLARVSPENASKVESTLKQFVRDWSLEGKAERDACYGPIVEAVQAAFPNPLVSAATGARVRIIVPGAGLCRLAFDLANLGYATQANEFSYHMILASNLVLNGMPEPFGHAIYPFCVSSCNLVQRADQLVAVRIPDVSPFAIAPGSDFSMAAGDFLEVYADERASIDCIACAFFIDTARNILSYVDAAARMLCPGGAWISCGPLLYHYAEMDDYLSVELSWDELRLVIIAAGFELTTEQRISCTYAANPRSMMKLQYECVFFVARRLGS